MVHYEEQLDTHLFVDFCIYLARMGNDPQRKAASANPSKYDPGVENA